MNFPDSRRARGRLIHAVLYFSAIGIQTVAAAEPGMAREIEITSAELEDRIRGGFLGQVLGNLNGLPHEMKYIDEPGRVDQYRPALADGARTDDDTDLEWIYVTEMAQAGPWIAPARIRELWTKHINRGIWCANLYARQLMDLGIDPPLTGRISLNPWSEFNISGQFICESFGLVAPAMPQTASRLGLHYTHVTIDGEPAQTTQLFCTMIALAFVERDVNALLDAGLKAIDPDSEIARVVRSVRDWHRQNPGNWQATRLKTKQAFQRHGGAMRDKNGFELNTASTIGALLYGDGDLVETLRLAFNFGWDCDNNAATAATILGVIRGKKWMDRQNWNIRDVYRNTTRDAMPEDETISRFTDKLVAAARRVILETGGVRVTTDGHDAWRIKLEPPRNVEELSRPPYRLDELKPELLPMIDKGLSGSTQEQARAAYLALCLDEAGRLQRERPTDWQSAIDALRTYPRVVREIFNAPHPSGRPLQERARASGLVPPED
jgi:hypothetical protein